jgi:ATP-binding cassette, subfamily B, bacterial MsbA
LATTDSTTSVQKTVRQRFARLTPFFGQPKSAWIIAFLAVAIAACTEPMIPAALKPLLDRGFQKGSLQIWIIPVTLIALFGVRGIAGFVAELAVTRVTSKGLMKLRQAMFSKVLDAKFNLFADQTSSELANTVVYEVNNGSTLLVNSLMALVRDTVTMIALVGYLLYLNWQLTTIVAIMLPAVAFIMAKLSKKLYGLSKASQKATDDLAYVVEENVLAHRDIRLHAAQTAQSERFMGISDTLRRLSMKTTAASAAMKPLTQMIAAIALSAIISVALLQSADGGTSVGEFTAFVTAMLLLVAPIKHLSEIANPITRGLASLERGFDLLDLSDSEQSGTFSKVRADGHIEFLDASVKYKEGAGFAVENLSLTIEHGETIALVGSSGSGKTTLVNLLPRFLEPFSGSITLDNQLLKDWDLNALRHQFSLVSQHVVMLNDTIANNVALGANKGLNNINNNNNNNNNNKLNNNDLANTQFIEVDRNKVLQCLEAARLSSFIADLPKGIDTVVGHNAVQLSGGQRQRLAIARALYKDAPILILDEATSALDAESERAVQEALQVLMKNRTTLVIAHRLSTVEHADRIVVMEAGKIIEIGSHARLLEDNGFYAKLYRLGLHST